MRCRCYKCHYNDEGYRREPDYVDIDENGKRNSVFIKEPKQRKIVFQAGQSVTRLEISQSDDWVLESVSSAADYVDIAYASKDDTLRVDFKNGNRTSVIRANN